MLHKKMAQGKNGFILYADLIHTVSKLPDATAGKLLKHILSYVNDEDPTTDDLLVEVAFEPIKQSLKRDLQKWEDKKGEKSRNGQMGNLKRYHADLFELVKSGEMTLEKALCEVKSRKTSPSEISDRQGSLPVANVAVSVSDSVSVTESVRDLSTTIPPTTLDVISSFVSLTSESDIRTARAIKKQGLDQYMHKQLEEVDKLHRLDGYTWEQINYTINRIPQSRRGDKVFSLANIRKKGRNDASKWDNIVASIKSSKGKSPAVLDLSQYDLDAKH